MVRWVVGSIIHRVDPLSYFSFQPKHGYIFIYLFIYFCSFLFMIFYLKYCIKCGKVSLNKKNETETEYVFAK